TPAAAGARSASLIFLDNTVTGTNTVQLAGSGILPSPTFKITAPASSATETSGTAFTFSVSVTSSTGTQPTGTVKMLLNGTAISGSPATLNSSGVASLSVTSTTTGPTTLSATYVGDSNYAAAGPITENITVNAPAVKTESKVTMKSSANPAAICKTITFSATVTGTGEEKPTGTVKLMKGADLLGEATLSKGEARLTGIKLAAGTSELTAHYGGDTTHKASTSAAFTQVVSDAGCTADAGTVKPGIGSAFTAR
ncbi:MAG TPA: Ig-like domain-containing protein, partial [Terracidiphilus sp.]|nr:Ig-like domain-containing protein [Terracidiphilus sp.]